MKWTRYLRCQIMDMKSSPQKLEKEVTIEAPWGNIAALSWGDSSNPPVLLCHGKKDVCSGFRPLVSRLPNCFFYLSIDFPGNGKSDQMPKGARYSIIDLVPTVEKVVRHFKWNSFMYIGHSLGVSIGRFYDIVYPGQISRTVELDPLPAQHVWPTTRESLQDWYHTYYAMYEDDKFEKYNVGIDAAPKYSYEKAQKLIMGARSLSKEAAGHVLERCLVPAGDGLYRFTYDQRMNDVPLLPFSFEGLKDIFRSTQTPTLAVLSKQMLDVNFYESVPFMLDEKAWPNNNYKFIIADGTHDVHLDNPGCIADDIAKFLLKDFKSKVY